MDKRRYCKYCISRGRDKVCAVKNVHVPKKGTCEEFNGNSRWRKLK